MLGDYLDMNIQEYYQKAAASSLNASLASLIPPFFLAVYGITIVQNGKVMIIMIPFLIYSFICYQFYLINDKRTKEIFMQEAVENHRLLDENQVLITFLPAPTLKMLIFHSNGQQIGEIRDMNFWTFRWFLPYFIDGLFKKRYGIYDQANHLVGSFILKNKEIKILDSDLNTVSTIHYNYSKSKSVYVFEKGNKRIQVKQSSSFTDYQFIHSNSVFGRFRKGWMPLEWGNRFKDPNTPIFTFEQSLSSKDKLLMYAILTKLLRCSNH